MRLIGIDPKPPRVIHAQRLLPFEPRYDAPMPSFWVALAVTILAAGHACGAVTQPPHWSLLRDRVYYWPARFALADMQAVMPRVADPLVKSILASFLRPAGRRRQ